MKNSAKLVSGNPGRGRNKKDKGIENINRLIFITLTGCGAGGSPVLYSTELSKLGSQSDTAALF